jgi:23S rRNA pseudouridine1911/1915/1917 synthase
MDDADAPIEVTLPPEAKGSRLDKALTEAAATPGLSRSRIRALIESGAVTRLSEPGGTVTDASSKVKGGEVLCVAVPPPLPAAPEPEDIPLDVVFEDAHLIVVNKPAGMVVHPAPGAYTGTLVNALLAHCGDTLSGVGGEKRPGIVHRIDKDTTGLLVVAKSDAAHQGLAAQFAAHDLERSYAALVWGRPDRSDARMAGLPAVSFEPGWVRVETTIGRSRSDRKKMAVNVNDGRRAVTRFKRIAEAGPCSLVECRLETGRTHQIRVHLTHLGHPLVGDQTYGRQRTAPASLDESLRDALTHFPRQGLHAKTLGFIHPVTGEDLRFESPLPTDLATLIEKLS